MIPNPIAVFLLLLMPIHTAFAAPTDRVLRFEAPGAVFLDGTFKVRAILEGAPLVSNEEIGIYVQDPVSGFFGLLTNDGVCEDGQLTFTVDTRFFPRGRVVFGAAIVEGEGDVLALPPEGISYTKTVSFLSTR